MLHKNSNRSYGGRNIHRTGSKTGEADRSGLDTYSPIEGCRYGIGAVISSMANNAAHVGKARHIPDADIFSITLKCHDPKAGLFFISIARNRITLSSHESNAIRDRFVQWVNTVPMAVSNAPSLSASYMTVTVPGCGDAPDA
jgi:hypothetical protein